MESMSMPQMKIAHSMLLSLNIKSRFWMTMILCIPIFMLNWGSRFWDINAYLTEWDNLKLQLGISAFVVFVLGGFFFTRAFKALMDFKLNMFTLIALAVGVAWFYSLFALIWPDKFPLAFRLDDGRVPVYFDAACYVTLFVILGQYLEMKARMQVNVDILRNIRQCYSAEEVRHIRAALTNARQSEIPLQEIINRVAAWFILIVMVCAVLAFGLWYWKGPAPSAIYALIVSVSVLLAACPCALTLAAPISIMISLNKAAAHGILINNPDILEKLHNNRDVQALIKSNQIVLLQNQNISTLRDADAILLNDDEKTQADFLKLADAALSNIKENLFLGGAYNMIAVPMAAGIFYPFWHVLLEPVSASFLMSFSSLIVVLNALRLKKLKL